jgi:hypothetical protein
MPPITISTTQLEAVSGVLRGIVRLLRRLAYAGIAGIAGIALLLLRDGYQGDDAVLTILCFAPPAILLFFTSGVSEVLRLPDRLRRMPAEGQERLAEIGQVAGDARTARARQAPLLLWRLRGTLGSLRDVAGFALPFRVFTPGFLGLAALSALLCLLLAGAGVICLLVLVAG